jgi:16S rRNA (adenine1518-N6/adenine1519-N6)-dimethyltransferase
MKLTNISVIKDLMNRHGFAFTKSLGQNFLINPSVCPRMAQAVADGGGENLTVVEIGAGVGVLTRELSRVARRVIVIEIDRKLEPILAETLAGCDNVEIIWANFLELDLPQILAERNIHEISVCANLPYYAATHIIMKLLELSIVNCQLSIVNCTAMLQEEVAQRFCARPGSKQYGIVSVAARFYSRPEMLFKVSRGSFLPAPNVDSAVLQLTIDNGQLTINERAFFRLVKAAFSERRKQLCNPVAKEFGVSKDIIKSMLKNPAARAEDLSVEDFIELYGKLEIYGTK